METFTRGEESPNSGYFAPVVHKGDGSDSDIELDVEKAKGF
jgi:hypothetical protein